MSQLVAMIYKITTLDTFQKVFRLKGPSNSDTNRVATAISSPVHVLTYQ